MDSENADSSVMLENIINLQVTESRTAEVSTTEKKKKKTSSTKKSSKKVVKQGEVFNVKSRVSDGKKIHVRSVDASQVQQKFNKVSTDADNATTQLCKLCNKQVFQMERVKAERFVWHKNCFSCTECKKKLTVDTYNSHEGLIYCKPHFKQLFQPKAVLDADEPYIFKPEMIIRESQPIELHPDVVRASETSSYGMEELSNLDLKSRFTMFERSASHTQDEVDVKEEHKVKRSGSILSKLAKFDRDNANLRNELGQLEIEDSSDDGDEGCLYDDTDEGRLLFPSTDGSVAFNPISNIKSKWEDGVPRTRKEQLALLRKEEFKALRARQCQGRQLRLKEQYEQAVQEGREGKESHIDDLKVDPEKIKHIKDVFEKGLNDEVIMARESEHLVDPEKLKQLKNIFENGDQLSAGEKQERQEEIDIPGAITKEARNMFKQMEENGFQDKHRKNKQSESYGLENKETFKSTSAMLDLFRRLEKDPDRYRDQHTEEEEDEEEEYEEESGEEDSGAEQGSDQDSEGDQNMTVGLTPQQQELLQIARDRAVAKNMREKFERWEFSTDEEKIAYEKTLMIPETEEIQASLNTARNLRAHFENLKNEPKVEKPHIKVNRFV